MDKYKLLSWILLVTGALIAVMFVGIFESKYPELTQTQLLLERWPFIIASFIFLTICYGVLRYREGNVDE